MTFAKFEAIFKTKYPDGEVVAHGKFGGTEGSKKTAVIFSRGGKVYDYYGAYDRILTRLGFNVINKDRVEELKYRLKRCYETHMSTENFFGEPWDRSEEIAEIEARLKDIEENWIIA